MNVSPEGYGTIEVGQISPSSYPFTYTFSSGRQVRLEAVPAPGHRFNHWSGDLSGNTNPTNIVIDCNKSITANFAPVIHTLTIQLSGNGATNPATGRHNYAAGAVVSLTAIPDRGRQFDSWAGDVADPSSTTTTLTMDSDKTVTAGFSTNWLLIGELIGITFLIGLVLVTIIIRRKAY